MRTRPYWQNVINANGGKEPTVEDLRRTSHIVTPPVLPATICIKCRGAGYLHYDAPLGHALFGKRAPCVCKQEEFAVKQRERSQRLADLTTEMRNMTLETFDRTCDPAAYDTTQAYILGRDTNGQPMPPWLYFESDPGGGKTHLMAAIAHAYIAQGETVMFRVVPKLLNWFKASFNLRDTDEMDYQCRFDEVCNVPLLLLDDLGAEYSTGWTKEQLFTLINHRYTRRLRTVFSTNVSVDMLDDRIRSRVCDTAVCETVLNTSVDYRTRLGRKEQRQQKGA